MITLLCGPSSVGKSTYYSSGLMNDFGAQSAAPLVFAHQLEASKELPAGDCVIHYNMMRPLHVMPDQAERPTNAMNRAWSFTNDPAWVNILALPGPKQAVVLVASAHALRDRAEVRRDTEPDLVAPDGRYKFGYWREVYEHANLQAIYSSLIDQLRRHDIAFRFVASSSHSFTLVDEPTAYALLRRERSMTYSAGQIAELIKPPSFEYQKVLLPYGLSTTGHDRTATCDAIFPTTMAGASVLDIGSALGAVCFEAEKRGATSVIGIEPRQSRFEASIVLKEILGSAVELRHETLSEFVAAEDGVSGSDERSFDYVLLLNVLHHLPNPIESLIQCASVTRSRLVIEFPTLDDPIFAGVPAELAARLNELSLIGVSTRAADQRFLFTPTALRRVLIDHHMLFSEASFMPSPMQGGRVIGTFEK